MEKIEEEHRAVKWTWNLRVASSVETVSSRVAINCLKVITKRSLLIFGRAGVAVGAIGAGTEATGAAAATGPSLSFRGLLG